MKKTLLVFALLTSTLSAFSSDVTVEGLPTVKTKVKSSLHLKSGESVDLNTKDRENNKKSALIKLKSYVETELGKKAIGNGECKRIDFKASYPVEGGREGWVLDECSLSFM